MNINEIETKALNLLDARLSAKPIPSFFEKIDLKTAQEVLKRGMELRLKRGEEITGLVFQKENYFSYLTNQMNLIPGSIFSIKDCILPKVSAHFVYYIDSRLECPSTLEKIIDATSSIGLALLISDSRFKKGLEVTWEERMADNFFSTYYFLGKKRLDLKEMKDRSVRVAIYSNQEKKMEMEVSDLLSGLVGLTQQSLAPSSIVLSPNLFDLLPLNSNMDISLVADYFGSANFKVI
jgi:2-keto-4-pentenoate hydratase